MKEENLVSKIIKLNEEGIKQQDIAVSLGITRSKVWRILSEQKSEPKDEAVAREQVAGRQPELSEQETQAASDSICGLKSNLGKPCPLKFTSEPCPWKHASDCPYTPKMLEISP